MYNEWSDWLKNADLLLNSIQSHYISIDITDRYQYLGITFSVTFFNAWKNVVEQAEKAIYLVFSKIKNAYFSVDLSLKLLHHMVLPIIMYTDRNFWIAGDNKT